MQSTESTRARSIRRRFAFLCAALLAFALLPSFGQENTGTPPSASPSDGLTILQAFYPDDENFASVAVIKAAIATFGYPGVFAAKPVDDGQRTKFRLRDGSTVEIANSDLEHGRSVARFVSDYKAANQQIAGYAATLYAVMIVRAVALSKPDNVFRGIKLSAQAELLLSGNMLDTNGKKRMVEASDLPVLLGLKCAPLTYRSPFAYVHTSGYHAAFGTGGLLDQEGTPTRLWKSNLLHGKMVHPGVTSNTTNFVLAQ